MEIRESVRIDRWLWAVRVFKTRSDASAACRGEKVKIRGRNVKPAHRLRIGETVDVSKGTITRTLEVLKLIEQRVGAPGAALCYQDRTPKEVYDKARERRRESGAFPNRKPNKRERRQIDKLRKQFDSMDDASSVS